MQEAGKQMKTLSLEESETFVNPQLSIRKNAEESNIAFLTTCWKKYSNC